jgi:hypothetical protein
MNVLSVAAHYTGGRTPAMLLGCRSGSGTWSPKIYTRSKVTILIPSTARTESGKMMSEGRSESVGQRPYFALLAMGSATTAVSCIAGTGNAITTGISHAHLKLFWSSYVKLGFGRDGDAESATESGQILTNARYDCRLQNYVQHEFNAYIRVGMYTWESLESSVFGEVRTRNIIDCLTPGALSTDSTITTSTLDTT